MNDQVVLAFSSCPDETVARHIAEALVIEQLAGCVNRIAGMRSSYFWDGRLQDDAEILLIMKTTADRVAQLKARLAELHPYELPEFVVTAVIDGNDSYLDWIRRRVGSKDNEK